MSLWKTTDYRKRLAETPQELERLLCLVADDGIDLIDYSQGRFWPREIAGSEVNFAGWTKKLSGKPTMVIGSGRPRRRFLPFHSTKLTLKAVSHVTADAKIDAVARVSAKGLDH